MKSNILKTYTLNFDGNSIEFHDLISSRTYSNRSWINPWHKFWYMEVKLFNIFSLSTTFSDGSYIFTSYRYNTKEEAENKRMVAVKGIKSIMGKS